MYIKYFSEYQKGTVKKITIIFEDSIGSNGIFASQKAGFLNAIHLTMLATQH